VWLKEMPFYKLVISTFAATELIDQRIGIDGLIAEMDFV
jgi:hypothetical protein